jgi:hypothetical protein
MTNEERASKLAEASRLCSEVAASLDITLKTSCEHCDHYTKNNPDEYRLHVELRERGKKLAVLAGKLRDGSLP